MRDENAFGENRLAALAFVIFLSPALRLFPSAAAAAAGRAAWLAAALCFIPAAGYLLFFCYLAGRRREGEGLCALLARALPGRAVRSGADRFIVAVYPEAPAAFFVLTMAAAALAAAFSPYLAAARTAKLFLPLLVLVLALVLGASLAQMRAENLFPLYPKDLSGLPAGLLPGLDLLSWAVYAPAFALGEAAPRRLSRPRLLGALALGCAALTLLGLTLVGCFGAPLAASLSWPFFSLVRNLVFFRSVERVEALVVALWVFPDFLIVSLFLRASHGALSLSLGRRFSLLGEKRAALPLGAAAACVFALFAAPDAQSLSLLSQTVIPACNLFFAFVFFPAILLTGRRKGRI